MPRGGSRPGSGGKRPGAGRKSKSLDRQTALRHVEPEIRIIRNSVAGKAVTEAMILASLDESHRGDSKCLVDSGEIVVHDNSRLIKKSSCQNGEISHNPLIVRSFPRSANLKKSKRIKQSI